MSRYSKVRRGVWNDQLFREDGPEPPHPRTLYFRLLFGPENSQIPGLFSAWDAGLARALGWSLDDFRACFQALEDRGLARADWRAGLVYLPGVLSEDQNRPQSPNVVVSWRATLDELPSCPLLDEAKTELRRVASLCGHAYAKAANSVIPPRSAAPARKPESLPERLTDSLPDSLPERLTDSLPDSLPESLPERLTERGEFPPSPNQDQDTRARGDTSTRPPDPVPEIQPVVVVPPRARAPTRDPDRPTTTTTTSAPPRDSGSKPKIPCPKDLALTADQRDTSITAGVPDWAVDAITREFVGTQLADPTRTDTLVGWRKLLSRAIHRRWSDPSQRPKRLAVVADPAAQLALRAASAASTQRLEEQKAELLRKAGAAAPAANAQEGNS